MISYPTHLKREKWGTCDATVGYYGAAGLQTARCSRPAEYVDQNEDGDGNHPRYCAECAKNA